MEKQYYEEYVKYLKRNEVFVFGSNLAGFHGAGSAGFASFGKSGNRWREEGYADKPHGWVGYWNVKGCGEGFQIGREGCSYAIPTVTQAGKKRSRTPEEIKVSIRSFYAFAQATLDWKYYVAQDVEGGLNGYSAGEMARMYNCLPIPENVYFYKPFWEYLTL